MVEVALVVDCGGHVWPEKSGKQSKEGPCTTLAVFCRCKDGNCKEGARKHFLFTAMDNYSLQDPISIFEDIYLSARDNGQDVTYPLIPEPESSLKRTA